MRTPKRGPLPTFPKAISINIGESFFYQWETEAEETALPMAHIARIAVDTYLSQTCVVICPTKFEEESYRRTTLQLSNESRRSVIEQASKIQTSPAQLTGMAIAARYIEAIVPTIEKTQNELVVYSMPRP